MQRITGSTSSLYSYVTNVPEITQTQHKKSVVIETTAIILTFYAKIPVFSRRDWCDRSRRRCVWRSCPQGHTYYPRNLINLEYSSVIQPYPRSCPTRNGSLLDEKYNGRFVVEQGEHVLGTRSRTIFGIPLRAGTGRTALARSHNSHRRRIFSTRMVISHRRGQESAGHFGMT